MIFDTTYNTNRFGLKLFQINGITSLGTIFPLAYGLTPTEDAPFFTWALSHLKEWFELISEHLGVPKDEFYPHVIITDYAAAARVGIESIFPNTQKQLCTWHIAKNVLKATKERWIGDLSDNLTAQDLIHNRGSQPTRQLQQGYHLPDSNDFSAAWRAVMYAPTTEDCDQQWQDLEQEFTHQERMCLFFFSIILLTALSSPDFLSSRNLDASSSTMGSRFYEGISQLRSYYDITM